MKILVAMSGGVDSSVVAHILKEEGHELIGVMMKLWTDPLAPEVMRALPTKCCSVEHIQRARSVCKKLDIPFYVLNIEEEFKKNVVDPFLQDYAEGKTPNPCINCNRTIKFGTLIEKMTEFGCERLATGHYARTAYETASDGSTRTLLLEARDKNKDQSYYLYGLTQEQLSKVMFPLGNLFKQDVYDLAEKYTVPLNSAYRESQDLCFFPEKEPEAFLRRYLPESRTGPIKLIDGTVVGEHKGLPYYTEGQRKLGVGGQKIPLYIVRKEQKSNTIFVASDGADKKNQLSAETLRWISWRPTEDTEVAFEARIHSLGEKRPGTLMLKNGKALFRFQEPLRGISPGQSLVLYRGEEVIGGGVICG